MNQGLFRVAVTTLVSGAFTFGIVGCGGADQTTGSEVKPDAEAAKRQADMTEYYKTNPLPKPKRK